MPSNEYQWFFFVLYTLGSVGGLVYIATWIVDWVAARHDDDEYDPWAEDTNVVQFPAPAPVAKTIEPPISARTK